jgi:hypothetical protein
VTSQFDRWLTTEPQRAPFFVDIEDYERDSKLEDIAPFEDTKCTRCARVMGGYLGASWANPDVETARFDGFYVMDVDGAVLLCEDCMEEVTHETDGTP